MYKILSLLVLVFSLSAFTVIEPTAVRLFPENSAQVVATINPSDDYKILSESAGWLMIEFKQSGKEIKGWIQNNRPTKAERKKIETASVNRDAEREMAYRTSSDPAYSFAFPTALQLPKGSAVARGLYFLGWTFEYTPTDTTSVGVRLTVPIGVFAGALQAKQTIDLSDEFHLGVAGFFGGVTSLFSKKGNHSAWTFGGGAMSTIGNAERGITFGGYIFGGGAGGYGHIFLLDANAHYRVTRRIKLMIDAATPLATHHKNIAFDWSAVAYGLRVGGESLSGDVGFLIPIYSNAGHVLRYIPLGFPFISLNVFF